jgi:hypothetical protein
MSGWLKRFGLHLAAAVGATGIFVAAAAVGANQTRQQEALVSPDTTIVARPSRNPTRRPTVEVAPTPAATAASKPSGQRASATPAADVRPERSLAGTVREVEPEALLIVGVGGRTWRVEPAPGALIRVNGKAAKLEAIQPGDGVVILGQAQPGPGMRFLAHAITAKSR